MEMEKCRKETRARRLLAAQSTEFAESIIEQRWAGSGWRINRVSKAVGVAKAI